MATFKLEINLDNDAFSECTAEAVSEKLKEVASFLVDVLDTDFVDGTRNRIYDANGNRCGWYEVVS